jgi:hypothetical protein
MGVTKRDLSGIFNDALQVNRRGMMFVSDQFVPEWTEMNVQMQVPAAGAKKQRDIHCRAAVVQCEKRSRGKGYQVALLFLDLPKRDEETLELMRPGIKGSRISISR